MSWLVISDRHRVQRTPDHLGLDGAALVASGSLVLEAVFTAGSEKPQILVDLDRTSGWHRAFRMTLRHDGELFVEHRQNHTVCCAMLHIDKPDREARLRLTYSWNGPARQGLLSAENLDTGHVDQAFFDDPQPWPMDDIGALTGPEADCRTDAGVSLIAVSDHIEAVGLPPGLHGGTIVETAAGPRAIRDLARGDLVVTAERGLQPVRWVLRRELPAAGRFAPIRLYAPFFGLDRDLTVAPDHRVLIEGADAEYLFGSDSVLVEARHLAGISSATDVCTGQTVDYVQVILDSHVCISASGAWVEALYVGNPAKHPRQLAATGLAQIPAHILPRHREIASPQLKSYEAVVLVSAICA